MKKAYITLAALAAVFVSGLAIAAPATFAKADTNGDGSVDATEFAASGVTKKMKELDKDGDGKLNSKEYSAGLEEDCE